MPDLPVPGHLLVLLQPPKGGHRAGLHGQGHLRGGASSTRGGRGVLVVVMRAVRVRVMARITGTHSTAIASQIRMHQPRGLRRRHDHHHRAAAAPGAGGGHDRGGAHHRRVVMGMVMTGRARARATAGAAAVRLARVEGAAAAAGGRGNWRLRSC